MSEELQSIIEKVRFLFLRYGIKSVTMDDIARELGISKKTLYQHVSDKTELVEKVVELEFNRRSDEYNNILEEKLNAIEELYRVNRYTLSMLKEFSPSAGYDLKKYYPNLSKQITDERRNIMIEIHTKNFEKGKKEGLYRTDFNENILLRLCVSRFETFLTSELFTRDEIQSNHFFKELFNYHIRGIANENGLKILKEKQKEFETENKN